MVSVRLHALHPIPDTELVKCVHPDFAFQYLKQALIRSIPFRICLISFFLAMVCSSIQPGKKWPGKALVQSPAPGRVNTECGSVYSAYLKTSGLRSCNLSGFIFQQVTVMRLCLSYSKPKPLLLQLLQLTPVVSHLPTMEEQPVSIISPISM